MLQLHLRITRKASAFVQPRVMAPVSNLVTSPNPKMPQSILPQFSARQVHPGKHLQKDQGNTTIAPFEIPQLHVKPRTSVNLPTFMPLWKWLARSFRILAAHVIGPCRGDGLVGCCSYDWRVLFCTGAGKRVCSHIAQLAPVGLLHAMRCLTCCLLYNILYFMYRTFIRFAAGTTLGHSLLIKASR